MFKWIDSFMEVLAKALGWNESVNSPSPVNLPNKLPPMSPIYTEAKSCLDTHITLNGNVPPDVGCAEAVSYVLKNSGITWIPAEGIAGTAQLWELLKQHGTLTDNPQPGAIVISPTGTSIKGVSHGHTGILLQYGIASNDSNTGLFRENYTKGSWNNLFHTQLGFPVFFYDLGV